MHTVPYRQEQLEVSPSEAAEIQAAVAAARTSFAAEAPPRSALQSRLAALMAGGARKVRHRPSLSSSFAQLSKCSQTDIVPLLQIILDTDIGTDIDDVLALLTALHMPSEHVELLGITTNYHPTRLRQGVAKAVVAAAAAAGAEAQPPEREDAQGERLRRAKVLGTVAARMAQIPIIAGSSQLCGTHRTLFHHGNEGEGLSWSPEEKLAAWESAEGLEAAEYIYETCSKAPGEVSIVMTGMATNVAMAAEMHPDFGDSVGHICMMSGGSFVTKSAASGRRSKIGTYRSGAEAAAWSLSAAEPAESTADAAPEPTAAPDGAATGAGGGGGGWEPNRASLPRTDVEAAEWLLSTARCGECVVFVDGETLHRSDIKLSSGGSERVGDEEEQSSKGKKKQKKKSRNGPVEEGVPPEEPAPLNPASPWVAYRDHDGDEYYLNQETEQTCWDMPAQGISSREAGVRGRSPSPPLSEEGGLASDIASDVGTVGGSSEGEAEGEVELPHITALEGAAISHDELSVGLRLLWVETRQAEGGAWLRYDSITWLRQMEARVPPQSPLRMCFLGESKPVVLFPNHNSSGDALATALVFRLRCPISVVPSQITRQFWLEGAKPHRVPGLPLC